MRRAEIVLTDGQTFVGYADREGSAVTLEGNVITRPLIDGKAAEVLGPAVMRTWPMKRVREIRWEVGD